MTSTEFSPDLRGYNLLVQVWRKGSKCNVTLCGDSSGYCVVKDVAFGLALQVAIEGIGRGARVDIDLGPLFGEDG